MAIQTQNEGRRTYLIGDTYPIRDQLRDAGAHWDAARKAWWLGSRERAEQLAGALAPVSDQRQQAAQPQQTAPGEGATVAGRAEYKGKTYYIAGRVDRGHTHYDDGVDAVTTRDGAKILLYFRDGSSQFWAARSEVRVVKSYDRPQTIRGLREYAARAKQAGGGRLEDGYYYGPGGEILASGCARCARLGHMCRSCEHDYE